VPVAKEARLRRINQRLEMYSLFWRAAQKILAEKDAAQRK